MTGLTTKAPTNKATYNKVFARIIEAMEAGTVPWLKPWIGGFPKNATTGRCYNGGNVIVLAFEALARGYTSSGWVTFNQAVKAGIVVRKGEKATPVYYMKKLVIKDKDAQPNEESSADKSIFLARLYYVFNLDQCADLAGCEGSLDKLRAKADVRFTHEPVSACEAMVSATGADIRNGGLRAFYNYAEDYIGMPARSSFISAERYYGTLFHELTHWTSKAGRCDRDLTKGRFGNPEYAAEELVAELGAAFLSNRFGFDMVSQNASYLKNWLKALKDDASMLVTAASAAQKAVDFLAPSAEEADAEEIEA